MAYFDGIKVGDKFYVGEKEYVVGECNGMEFCDAKREGPYWDYSGVMFKFPYLGQLAFWQPVHIDPPPRPKRMVTKEKWLGFWRDSQYVLRICGLTTNAFFDPMWFSSEENAREYSTTMSEHQTKNLPDPVKVTWEEEE